MQSPLFVPGQEAVVVVDLKVPILIIACKFKIGKSYLRALRFVVMRDVAALTAGFTGNAKQRGSI